MLKRYIGIGFVIIGALIMLSTVTLLSGIDNERYVRISGGILFFLGTLFIPDKKISKNKNNRKETEKA